MPDLIRRYSELAEEFRAELSLEHYLAGSGRKGSMQVTHIYERGAWLFARETIEALKAESPSRQSLHLIEFAVLGHLQNAVREFSQAIANHDLAATVLWDGQAIPYRRASVDLVNEPDMARRHELERRLTAVTAQADPLRREQLAVTHNAVSSLGYGGYVEMCDALRQLKLADLQPEVNRFMKQTSIFFAEEQSARFHCERIPAEEATNADSSRLLRAAGYDHLFPPHKLIYAIRATLQGLGIDLERQSNLYLDLEPRPLKSPRAFCSSIRVPEDVRLVVAPSGGVDDYRSLLHEVGHAEHAVGTDRAAPFAFKRLGDASVTEMYAFLFDNLLHNARWLKDTLNVADEQCRRLSLFQKLRLLRRYGGKLIYELELHRTDGQERMAARYVEILGQALGVRIASENYLADVDDALYFGQYLRAWLGEIRLRGFLEREFGEGWFARRSAGDFLRDLWLRGQEFTVEEILLQCGCAPMSADLLVTEAMALAG